jgi:serine phosphatase RsbU (regulator of sigma subunit)
MPHQDIQIEDLLALNQIIESLNRTVDVRSALDAALARLLEIMHLKTGWIFLRDPTDQNLWAGRGYRLAAHLNLPPAIAADLPQAWNKGCDCQGFCDRGMLTGAYNEVHCSRLGEAQGDRRGLVVHASTPLRSGEDILGILNVAASDWGAFSSRALALLTNVGEQMGAALERAYLYDLLSARRIQEQRALLEMSDQLLRRLELVEVLEHLVAEVPRLLEADACALLLHDHETHELRLYAVHGWWNADQGEARQLAPDLQAWLDFAMHSGQLQAIPDLSAGDLPETLDAWLKAQGFIGTAFAPLVVDSGPLGMILLGSRKQRTLDENDVHFIQLLANQASLAIEKSRLHQAELIQQRLEAELDVAQGIQRSLLPAVLPSVDGWDFAAYCKPARQLGGDFYDIFKLPGRGNRLGVIVADVVDKGVPAALLMVLCRTLFRATAISERPPVEALKQANVLIRMDSGRYRVYEQLEAGDFFVSAIYAALDLESGGVTYANAGHDRPLWLRSEEGKIEQLTARGIVLGLYDQVDLQEGQVVLAPGESLILYTDGLTEAMNAEGEIFGDPRLLETLSACQASSAQALIDALVDAVLEFTDGAPQSDDLTIFVIRRDA